MVFPEVLTVHQVVKSIDAVVNEWRRLGLELGVPHSTLETIKYNHPTDVEACKMKMVEQWLKQPHPLWCSLVEALNEIGLKFIANQISENYSTSKFIFACSLLLQPSQYFIFIEMITYLHGNAIIIFF